MKRDLWMIPFMALIVLVPALINGFPLVYSDTGTYIVSGFERIVPVDRPVTYGLFLHTTSLHGITLWLPVIVQALLCAVFAWRLRRMLAPASHPGVILTIILLLSAGTALGWYGGRLQPDIFTGLAITAVLLQCFSDQGRGWMFLDAMIIILACITHLSNIPILGGLLILLVPLAVLRWPDWRTPIGRILLLFIPLVLSIALIRQINRSISGDPAISSGGHVFIMGRLLDAGLLHPWLDQDCMQHDHFLCRHRERIPADGQKLLWAPESPMNDHGGWLAVKAESDAMLARFFSRPGNVIDFILAGVKDTGIQLTMWGLEHEMLSHWYRTLDSPPSLAINTHVPQEMQAYLSSLQNGGRGELRMTEVNILHHLILGCSLVMALLMLASGGRRGIGGRERALLLYVLLAVIVGAGCSAALSVPDQRFLAKVTWPLPLVVMLIASRVFQRRTAEDLRSVPIPSSRRINS